MKFYIEKVIIWQKNGNLRELKFEPNKVNVITGHSNTGKTAVYEIIDYCFFASKSKISESMINEKVNWYGLLFHINDKRYCIARKSLTQGKVSSNYYFSSNSQVPPEPTFNNDESSIKVLIETEFGINKNVKVAYGSNTIKADSKISLRYFLLFNYISQSMMINDTIFIETLNNKKYSDAIPRVFDIATGIETIKNKLLKEKLDSLQGELNKLNKKNHTIHDKASLFQAEKSDVLKTAREYGFIETGENDDIAFRQLLDYSSENLESYEYKNQRFDLEKKRDILKRKIRILNDFVAEYDSYKNNLANLEDSLKPIEALRANEKVIKNQIYENLLSQLNSELHKVREVINEKAPINIQIVDEKNKLQSEILKIETQLESLPESNKVIEPTPEKYMFIGALKEKSKIYGLDDDIKKVDYSKKILDIEAKIQSCQEDIVNTDEKKELTIKLIEEIILDYIKETGKALKNYSTYIPVFDYKNKLLKLRKPLSTDIENVGSASNFMFFQLYFSLALHEVIFLNKSNFVPPFLIIDQFSTPYYDGNNRKENTDGSDDQQIYIALQLLNNYIKNRLENDGEFQMIVFEHIPPSYFENLEHFHLVDKEFKNGNALIND